MWRKLGLDDNMTRWEWVLFLTGAITITIVILFG